MKARIVILGNRRTCGASLALKTKGTFAALVKAFPAATVIDADKTENATAYKTYRPHEGFAWPTIRTYGADGKTTGSFLARGMTNTQTISKIKALCPACSEACDTGDCADTVPDAPVKRRTCPTCKGSGFIAVALCGLLSVFCSGCLVTRISTPQWTLTRAAMFTDTGIPKITVLDDGTCEVEGYTSKGDSATLQAAVEAGFKAGTAAAKKAVMP